MDITFYDFDFNRLGSIPNPVSVNFEKKYCGYGTVELHFDVGNTDLIQLLDSSTYLFFITEQRCAIVTGWIIGEDISIYGRTPEWLLTKRGIQAFSATNTTAETIARTAVQNVPDFVELGTFSNVGTATSYSTDGVRVLYDVVCEVLKPQKLGFEVYPDISGKRFVFRVYEGAVQPCTLSSSNRTSYNMKYTVEKQDFVTNSGWYEQNYTDLGSWDAAANNPRLYDGEAAAYTYYRISSDSLDYSDNPVMQFDLWCQKDFYLYCDNNNGTWKVSSVKPDSVWLYINGSSEVGIKRWDAVLKNVKTTAEAVSELAQLTKKRTADCETCNIDYGKDYYLGDIVNVQCEFRKFKKVEQKRVTSVNIYYDVDTIGVIPILSGLEE